MRRIQIGVGSFALSHFRMQLLLICLTLAGVWPLAAADWPQWRGPNRDGKAAEFNAPQNWPKQLVEKWKVTVGVGDSTPALVGNRLYTFGRQKNDEVIQCLEASNGKTIWKESYPAGHVVTGPPARHPGTRSSPAIADGKICALGVGGILSCLDASSGKVLWRKQSTNDYLGIPYNSDTAMSPIIVDGQCIVHVGGKTNGAVIAFDLASGEPKWQWNGDGPGFSSPVVMTVQGTKQLVTLSAKSVVGLSLAGGKLLWQVPFEAAQGNNATPIVDGQRVIYTGQGKGLFALKIEAKGDSFAATPIWTNTQLGARFTTPVLHNRLVIGYTGHFFCADAQTGATLWTDTTNRGNSAALVDAGSVIFAVTVNSELVAFSPSDKAYTEFLRCKVAESETWAHPVMAGDRVFVRDRDSVTLWGIE